MYVFVFVEAKINQVICPLFNGIWQTEVYTNKNSRSNQNYSENDV